jgi:hypothetical protein
MDGCGLTEQDTGTGCPQEISRIGQTYGPGHSVGHRPERRTHRCERLDHCRIDPAMDQSIWLLVDVFYDNPALSVVGAGICELDPAVADKGDDTDERVIHQTPQPLPI